MAFKGVAIVTGSAQGIGRAIASRLAKEGYDVGLNDLTSTQGMLETLQKEITSSFEGRRAIIIPADVSNEDEVKLMVEIVVEKLGGLDVMIANAGIAPTGTIVETNVEDWDRAMAVNLRGTFLSYKHAAMQMIKQGRGGRIVGASSGLGKQGQTPFATYCTTKFGIRGLTQATATELGKHKITVNAYAPGWIQTPMTLDLPFISGDPEILMKLAKDTALGRCGTPEEIASWVSYVVSEEASFITGQTVCINGGWFFD